MSPSQKKKVLGVKQRGGAKSISKLSSIGKVNFRKSQANVGSEAGLDFLNAENALG